MTSWGRSIRLVFGTVRARTTLASGLVVACALAIGGTAFVALLGASLTSGVDDTAQQRAQLTIAALRSGSKPPDLVRLGEEDVFVQILDREDGSVLATSDPKLTDAVASVPGRPSTVDHIPIDDGTHSFRVVEKDVQTSSDHFRVISGASMEHVKESTRAVRRMLVYGGPALLGLVVLTTWIFTGRALRPVESVRSEVSAISGRNLDRRLKVPETQDEIARLTVTMNEMLDRLTDSSARQRRFISDASHELRSPITTIRHHAEVAAAHPESTSLQELSLTVLEEEERLENLVNDLLVLARADEHTLGLAREPIDLDDLVFQEAARLRTVSDVKVDTSRVSAARVEGDSNSLRRALRNVADNALRHARGRIAFEVSMDGRTARVVVLDDGEGIPDRDRARIFERFTRLGDARDRDSGGSGLGLSIVTEIMSAHDGYVTVGDAPGTGARFELSLPALRAAST
jgi:signal transduction histidine kinase